MSLEHLDVVHVGLPVFDVTGMVTRHHPGVVVRPYHAPYGTVMGLKQNKERHLQIILNDIFEYCSLIAPEE